MQDIHKIILSTYFNPFKNHFIHRKTFNQGCPVGWGWGCPPFWRNVKSCSPLFQKLPGSPFLMMNFFVAFFENFRFQVVQIRGFLHFLQGYVMFMLFFGLVTNRVGYLLFKTHRMVLSIYLKIR